jgi:hypothetical protein
MKWFFLCGLCGRRQSLVAAVALAGVWGGCSSEDRDNGGVPNSPLVAIAVSPEQTTVVGGGQSGTVQFAVTGLYEDGSQKDLSAEARFSVFPAALGSFASNVFSTSNTTGGAGTVTATAGGRQATASILVTLNQVFLLPPTQGGAPLPENTPSLFEGAEDAARAPMLVYPNDGVVVPPNLKLLEVHWLKGVESNTLFELSFVNDLTDYRVYTRCERPESVQPDGCVWQLSDQVWSGLANTNRGGQPLTIRIRATDDEGTGVGVSQTRALEFSYEEINGAVYYWNAKSGYIVRYDFGGTSLASENVLGPSIVTSEIPNDRCVGCHTISQDGKKMAASTSGSAGGFVLFDIGKQEALHNDTGEGVMTMAQATFRPDGNRLAMVRSHHNSARTSQGLIVYDTTCEAADKSDCGVELPAENVSLGGLVASQPAWAPDDSQILFTNTAQGFAWSPLAGAISFVERTPTGWSAVQEWVAAAAERNRYSGVYAPDSSFIVFNESTCPAGEPTSPSCDGYTDSSAMLWASRRDTKALVELKRANAGGTLDTTTALSNTYPGMSPFVSSYKTPALSGGASEPLMWLTFSSVRRYGLRTPPARPTTGVGASETGFGAWLWMAAVKPSALAQGQDPSFPAFALPFQDFSTYNHIVMWTREAVPITF